MPTAANLASQAIRWLHLLSIVSSVMSQYFAEEDMVLSCAVSNNTASNTFTSNLNILFNQKLHSEAGKSLYYNASEGEFPDSVYGLYLCKFNVSFQSCQNCIVAAVNSVLQKCSGTKEAFIWYQVQECMVRFSDHSSSIMDTSAPLCMKIFQNTYNVTKSLAQSFNDCIPVLSVDDCRDCLNNTIRWIQRCFDPPGMGFGRILFPSCIMGFELYRYSKVPAVGALAPSSAPGGKRGRAISIAIGTTLSALIVVLFEEKRNSQEVQFLHWEGRIRNHYSYNILRGGKQQAESQEFPLFPLRLALEATNHFSDENKLGQGGFGPVYKIRHFASYFVSLVTADGCFQGTLADGKAIAVKRLSRTSGQGLQEFKNEVNLIAKLQHKNLVRLLGCCLEGQELLLIYEYMPNKSLDVHLFAMELADELIKLHLVFNSLLDATRSVQLDWKRRQSIINGIARDFGLARIFGGNQNQANTNIIAGTYGYMAPEYAMGGIFSIKSDVFSFGVLLLEIISGRKNNGFYFSEHGQTLLTYTWKLWCEGPAVELIDPVLKQSCAPDELLKFIHIGLLCVQQDPADRPTMSSVVVMLASDSMTIPQPTEPAFSVGRVVANSGHFLSPAKACTVNNVTVSDVSPRSFPFAYGWALDYMLKLTTLHCRGSKRQDMVHIISVTKVIQLIFIYSLTATLHDPAFGDSPPYNTCSSSAADSGHAGAIYSNLKKVLISLALNASAAKFSDASSGNDSDRVYGLYMCLNYISNDTCNNCITTATKDITKLCPNKTDAIVWEEVCQLRYAYGNFFGQLDVSGNIPKYNRKNISEPERYRSVVNNTLNNLTKLAAFDPSNEMYATGEVPFTNSDTLYALVQCTKDLSADDCDACLNKAIADILSCCYFSRGARLLSRSCYLRYELYAFYNGDTEASVSVGNQASGKSNQRRMWMIIILAAVAAFLLLVVASTGYFFAAKKVARKRKGMVRKQIQLHKIGDASKTGLRYQHVRGRDDDLKAQDFYIDLETLDVATSNFSDSNMLGQGGFGPVYKGVLSDGKEIAVKRLSSCSEQGNAEFTNEVLLILKLQHKNLVKLLGFCVDGDEKLLVYEFMPNSSLDAILFDPRKRGLLCWSKRINIVNGIVKGILYLHEDSRLRIIHRDLKASNVLLDYDMNPKISDFGMARIFAGSEGEVNTARIVGTYGYMAPEYAMEGLYSIKSDVFSFGILLIEIITGRRNRGFNQSRGATAPNLLAYAWHLWNEGNALDLIDPLLTDTCSPDEFLRYIHIGLLCVQEDAFDRPTMSSVVVMLQGETITLCQPQKPAFSFGRLTDDDDNNYCSVNGLTISDLSPR
ncbi:cysteine-rich receptor-like protein kinase 10 [Citrus sinensis]|uniref:Cysteine-rich receptor-like protein kinase 10 n=1 Tax=Citrus sinensis TaxID=2711 RepID=A0ACB8NEH0_CITSI|nr:cysteine-rich receptor-like protein kinase 10 [Citrus sinensis]